MNPDLHRELTVTASHIVIVDDEIANVRLLQHWLALEGYTHITGVTDPDQALPICRTRDPDIVLLDLKMPGTDGYTILRELKTRGLESDFVPILVLTADLNPEARNKALMMGATDFLTKPMDASEIVFRIRNFLQMRQMHKLLRMHNEELESKVRERTAALEASRVDVIVRLAKAGEFRDDDTGEHTRRVGELSALIAERLPGCTIDPHDIELAAILHDVGKIGIPDSILLKPGKLTSEEFELMKSHTEIGNLILRDSPSPILKLAASIALCHHERWDGSGYPYGLSGKDIPIEGRIVAVADVFDALAHQRPYKRAWTFADTLAEIERSAGTHFDPEVVRTFLSLDILEEAEAFDRAA